jgi:hypothetical protein
MADAMAERFQLQVDVLLDSASAAPFQSSFGLLALRDRCRHIH